MFVLPFLFLLNRLSNGEVNNAYARNVGCNSGNVIYETISFIIELQRWSLFYMLEGFNRERWRKGDGKNKSNNKSNLFSIIELVAAATTAATTEA